MSTASTIKTTGQLRDFLTGVMENVRNGKCNYEKASQIVKAAGQINESIYAELKTNQVNKQLGGEVHKFGEVPLGGAKAA